MSGAAVTQPDSSNFDNDFEKLDPLASGADDAVSSSEPPPSGATDGDQFASSEAQPLVDLAEEPPSVQDVPQVQPDSSTKKEGKSLSVTWMNDVDPRVVELIYWRDVKKSGVVFGSMLVLLLSLALFSVLSVIAYLALAILTITLSFRVYKQVLNAVQKSGEGHPFKKFLEADISLPEEKVHELADVVMTHATCTAKQLRRLFLIEDVVDSLKFGLLLWVLTFVGAWFNGMTLIILGLVGIFTLPKVYETYKVPIDQNVELILAKVKTVVNQIKEKVPLPGKKKAA